MKYEINNIYNEDSYKAIKDIPDNLFDLIHIDPPYQYLTGGKDNYVSKRPYNKEYYDITLNKHTNPKERVWLGKEVNREEIKHLSNGFDFNVLDDLVRIMKKINIYIWCSKHQILELLTYFSNKDCNIEILTWHKRNPLPTANNCYLNDTEYIIFAREKGVKVYGTVKTKKKYYISNVNRSDKEKYLHPTIKPLEMVKNFIINSSKVGDLVGDIYLGSGTTVVGAIETGRKYMGFEINKKYFDIAVDRKNGITASGQTSLMTNFEELNL